MATSTPSSLNKSTNPPTEQTPPPASQQQQQSSTSSYTAMEFADVEAIGAHCQMPFCHQLDFLPFRCDSCHLTYCLDHRSETAHKCAHEGEWARNRRLKQLGSSNSNTSSPSSSLNSLPLSSKPTLLTAQQCSDPSCKTFINTTQSQAVHCQTCNRQYCLKHRFEESHDCKNLIPLGARPPNAAKVALQSNADKIRLGFGKLKSWGKDKQDSSSPSSTATSKSTTSSTSTTTTTTTTSKPSTSTFLPSRLKSATQSAKSAQVAQLNKLKSSAKGDLKIPLDKRTYLHVEAETSPGSSTSPSPPKKDLFFNSDWPVGRLLDEAARKLGVENNNNNTQGEEGRLRIYHVESGQVLRFKDKIGDVVTNGNTIVLLRGVGDPEA